MNVFVLCRFDPVAVCWCWWLEGLWHGRCTPTLPGRYQRIEEDHTGESARYAGIPSCHSISIHDFIGFFFLITCRWWCWKCWRRCCGNTSSTAIATATIPCWSIWSWNRTWETSSSRFFTVATRRCSSNSFIHFLSHLIDFHRFSSLNGSNID